MRKEALQKNKEDVAVIMSKINQNGGDYWATKDNGIGKGSPFSTKDAAIMLHELGYKKKDPIIQKIADTIFNTWQDDGRFKIAPTGAIYPCHTIGSARALCYLGFSKDKRIKQTFKHLIEIQHEDGGWQCNKFSFGRGSETNHSNPGPTLEALDAFRHTGLLNSDSRLDKAVEFLLWHWKFKKPVGPCQFGIGSLFMKTEFPFFRYNLFYFCYVLSFYKRARNDKRFNEALKLLNANLENDKIVIDNPNRQLSTMNFCSKGQPSDVATMRYRELLNNLEK
jgi:hypothetical protein